MITEFWRWLKIAREFGESVSIEIGFSSEKATFFSLSAIYGGLYII